jgi:ligand-binding sensor domain-containing protein
LPFALCQSGCSCRAAIPALLVLVSPFLALAVIEAVTRWRARPSTCGLIARAIAAEIALVPIGHQHVLPW